MSGDGSERFFPCSKSGGGRKSVVFFPAAGNRDGSDVNNVGNNGNYWSSSLNEKNENNARNLNFNEKNANWNNNNNRNNGFPVRAVRAQHLPLLKSAVHPFFYHYLNFFPMPYHLTKTQLLSDLYTAYKDARRHKRNKPYQKYFEKELELNLYRLCQDLWNRTYRPNPSTCFIITDPKKREVFAAEFRDRIVHHLYYNYTHEIFERTFIQDSYSCIKGRGTHYGIDRLEGHILQESQNYQETCYVLKMDIRGYFMHISRPKLLDIALYTLDRMSNHRISGGSDIKWGDKTDMDFVSYLTREIIMLNPVEGCRVKGRLGDWDTLAYDKSLFHSDEGCGLPIGNLTSQLFSNVYLNELDQYMKRELKCRHYGRYVDDFYVVSADKEWLLSLIPKVRDFLSSELTLGLHEGKTVVCEVRQGVEFLGAYLKPWRRYISNKTLRRMEKRIPTLGKTKDPEGVERSKVSYKGILSHYRTRRICQRLGLE